jgi:tetratricopeptide (TPR) repeat protein
VDATRAYVSLAAIEPRPTKPKGPASLPPLSERASRQIARATQLVEQERFTEAAIELERALRYDPNHPAIHRTLAQLHWEAGNIERARSHAERALEGNRDDAAAHYIVGRCHLLGKDSIAAVQAFRTALLCSDFLENRELAALCHFHLARALAEEQYLTAALEQYAAFELSAAGLARPVSNSDLSNLVRPGADAVAKSRAEILESLGRFGEAADAIAPAVAAAANDVDLGSRHAKLLLRAGRFEDALRTARSLPADDGQVLSLLFEIHDASGHPERMADELRSRRTQDADNAEIVLQLADVLVRLGNSSAAVDELIGFLEGHPEAGSVRGRLVELLIENKQWAEALGAAAEGIERDASQTPIYRDRLKRIASNPEAVSRMLEFAKESDTWSMYYLAGAAAVAAGRHDEAETAIRTALARRSDFIPAREALAEAYLNSHRYAEALATAGRSDPEVAESKELELILGEIHDRLDDVDKADRHFRAAQQMDRSDPRSMVALARVYGNAGRRLQAQRQLRAALERFPDHDLAREMLVESYLQDGQFDAAIEQIEELRRRASSPLVRARSSALLTHVIRNQDVEAYRRTLREAIDQHGEDAETWLSVAESYGPEGDPEEKAEAYRKALALDPQLEEGKVGLVDTSRRLLAFEESAAQLESLLERRPNRTRWRLAYVELLQILHRHDDALAAARAALLREGISEDERLRYQQSVVDILRAAGRKDATLSELEALAKAEPDRRDWQLLLADEYLRQEMAEKALAVIERTHAGQNEWRSVLTLANAMQAAKQYDRALQALLGWLSNDPENDTTLAAIVQVLAGAERYDEALEIVRNRVLHTLQRQAFQNEEIHIHLQAKDHAAALNVIDALLDEASIVLRAVQEAGGRIRGRTVSGRPVHRLPDEPFTLEEVHRRVVDLRLRRADALIRDLDAMNAERELNEWLEDARSPQERFYYLAYLGRVYRARQMEAEATDVLARALLLQPQNEGLNNDVAYGWIDRGVKIDEAEPMIRFAVAEQPRNAAFLDTYGWLLYKKGDFASARKWLERARLALRDDDPVIADHLGDVLWRLGDRDGAIRAWEEAVSIVAKRPPDDTPVADVERVRGEAPAKIEEARAGGEPGVAALALPRTESAEPSTGVPESDHPPTR